MKIYHVARRRTYREALLVRASSPQEAITLARKTEPDPNVEFQNSIILKTSSTVEISGSQRDPTEPTLFEL
jgi:hypothetical protein